MSEVEIETVQASSPRRRRWLVVSLVMFFVLGLIGWYALSPVTHVSEASAERSFTIQCKYSRFRQLMIRKSPTEAIVAHGGMKLINETVQDLKFDRSKDDRPILNAIRGQSKVELDAVRTLIVELNDPQIKTEQLTLRQIADIDFDQLNVNTQAVGKQQSIQAYETTLGAVAQDGDTAITLSVLMTIEIDVPRLFTGVADKRIQEAAERALADQQDALTAFVIDHADDSIVLPDLFKRSGP